MGERLKLLYTREEIAGRVRALASAIDRDYAGADLVLVGILKGAFVFLADLIRELKVPPTVDFIGLSSYGQGTAPSGHVRLTKDLGLDIRGRDVLVVEDILDTGETLARLLETLRARGPRTLRTCLLIDKRYRRRVPVPVDYCGFVLDEGFVVGYGIDYAERYRHLPAIHVVEVARGEGA